MRSRWMAAIRYAEGGRSRLNRQGVPMSVNQLLVLGASALAAFAAGPAVADDMQRQYARVAEIEIDPAQLENYNPARVRVFKIYRDAEAYRSHLETAHFKKYKATTEKMVRSLKLVQTIP